MTGNIWIIIGGIAAAIAAIAIPYGFYRKSKDHPETNLQIAGDYIEGDKVEGDKTVNIIISDPAMEARIQQLAAEQHKELITKYPQGSAVFGITQRGFVVPKGLVPPNSQIQWDTAKILELTEKSITILLPHMIINTETNKGLQIIGNKVSLPKKVNAKRGLIGLPNLRIQVEILGIDPQMVIVGIGFIPIEGK